MGIHFDTLEFVKTLTASGLPPPHAEAIARAHAKSMGNLVEHDLATKPDIKVLRAEIKADIDGLRSEMSGLRSELKADMSSLRSELKADINSLRSELKAEFQTELRSLKYAASIAMAFLSLVVIMSRFIK